MWRENTISQMEVTVNVFVPFLTISAYLIILPVL